MYHLFLICASVQLFVIVYLCLVILNFKNLALKEKDRNKESYGTVIQKELKCNSVEKLIKKHSNC